MANFPQLDDNVGVWKLKDVNDAVMGGYWRVSSGNSGLFGGGQSSNAANSQSVVDQFNFASSGIFVNDLGFNNNYLTIGSTTAYQTVEFPLVFTFGRSTTATEVRIQFDHVSSTTNLSTVITGISGYVENTV